MNNTDKLNLLMEITGKSQSKLAVDLGVAFSTFNNWYLGKSSPRKSQEYKINKLLITHGVTIPNSKDINEAKRSFITSLSKNNVKFSNREDMIKELSLHVTYNTNAIEGSTLTLKDTTDILLHKKNLLNKTLIEQLEAINHDKALRYVIEFAEGNNKIDESFILQIHKILMNGILLNSGEFRTHKVRIVGSFVPTANYLKIPELIGDLFIRPIDKDIVQYISWFHSEFEKIHPFSDGNGRTGRLILIAQCIKYNIPPVVIRKTKRPVYYKALQKAQLQNDFTDLENLIIDSIIYGSKLIA